MIVLRFAVGAVFLWFGIDKWIHPDAWYGWIPQWLWSSSSLSLNDFLFLDGILEFSIGIFLVAGLALRSTTIVAGLFLLGVTLSVGVSEVTIRDAALLGSCLALFLHANAKAKRPVSENTTSLVCTLYVMFLFVYGIIYLRSGA